MDMVKRSGNDGKTWQCGRPCETRESIRKDTFFSQSNLRLATIVEFIYAWSYEELTYKKAQREFKMGTHAFVDWKMFLRDLCAEHFIRNPVQIGGPGRIVEIDESVFTRQKYNRGRLAREQWVSAVYTQPLRKGLWYLWLIAMPTLPIIQEFVIPGTTIVSDLWGAYNRSVGCIQQICGVHTTDLWGAYNRSVGCIQQICGVHTTDLWGAYNRSVGCIQQICGVHTTDLWGAYNRSVGCIQQICGVHTTDLWGAYNRSVGCIQQICGVHTTKSVPTLNR